VTDVAAVAFTPAPRTDSPNVKAPTDAAALAAFHRLMGVGFAALRRWNPDLRLVLVSTQRPGGELDRLFDRLGVSLLVTPFAHRPPPGFYDRFNASLYTVDALTALTAAAGPGDRVLLLDPDVVCSAALGGVFADVRDDAVLAYDVGLAPDVPNQGLTALAAAELHRRLDPRLDGVPAHYGGELYGFTRASWAGVAGAVEAAWEFSLEQWRADAPRFVTEEHLLNYALRSTRVVRANDHVRRIWTAPVFRNVRPGDRELPLWHLPAEKARGFPRLYEAVGDPGGWFWTAPQAEWRARAGRIFGIPSRSPARLAHDVAGRTVRTAQRRARTLPRRTAALSPRP
jgi:hypothetical protein